MKKLPWSKQLINRTLEILDDLPVECFHGDDGKCIMKSADRGFGYVLIGDLLANNIRLYHLPEDGSEPRIFESGNDLVEQGWVVD
jgi:hypothetical protein